MIPADQVEAPVVKQVMEQPAFSFIFDGRPSTEFLNAWRTERKTERVDGDRSCSITSWTDAASGLRVTWTATRYSDFPAAEWVLHLENTGKTDTPIIENVQALDLTLRTPLDDSPAYRLHRTNGAPTNPTDFEVFVEALGSHHGGWLGGGGGRSSNKDFPFFRIDTGQGVLLVAVGWSGQWAANLSCPDDKVLRVTAGLELTHFCLHPGEKVRTPRMLLLQWLGDPAEAHAQIRQLIYKHYAATRAGQKPLPTPFCNTCFTRGGGWLNECNAENQISLINAYAPLGLEALITDAGWFEGGWPMGAGNWTPRKDAYPQGMGPVAAAAKEHGLVYGLWFEPERVVAGSTLHREHPEWLLSAHNEKVTYLADFGRPEVRDYFFNIVAGFMKLPGFRFYRQDFNMDPLPYWRHSDAPDRQGISEMRYIEGLYEYWDRIAAAWPDSMREECASGGRRIDLETVMRMHLHQKSDYWFDNEVDQASLWGLSQYLPNGVITVPLTRLDDYSFHSTLASSLLPGWIADAPDFDAARAKKLMERFKAVRHLLNGAWYGLLPYARDKHHWIASQYHRPDLDEGMVLVFRRAECAEASVNVALRGLSADATYELRFDVSGETRRVRGSELMSGLKLTLPAGPSSELITYRRGK
jgi:alpha-galactosidase